MPVNRKIRVFIETDQEAATVRKALSEESCTVLKPRGPFQSQTKGYHIDVIPGPEESDAEVRRRIEIAWDDYLTLNSLQKQPPPPKRIKWAEKNKHGK